MFAPPTRPRSGSHEGGSWSPFALDGRGRGIVGVEGAGTRVGTLGRRVRMTATDHEDGYGGGDGEPADPQVDADAEDQRRLVDSEVLDPQAPHRVPDDVDVEQLAGTETF